MTEHKWARIICAMAAGKKVEYKSPLDGEWQTPFDEYVNPISLPELEWRIKPTEQEKPMPTSHPHAASMLLYAQDMAIDGEAWKNWEFYSLAAETPKWRPLNGPSLWIPNVEYRRKPPAPKMLKVTTHSGRVYEFPEPMKTAPADGMKYFTPEGVLATVDDGFTWWGDPIDRRWLSNGLCHLTREAAEQHAAALLAVNRGE